MVDYNAYNQRRDNPRNIFVFSCERKLEKSGVLVLEDLTDGQRSYDDKATRFGVLLKIFDACQLLSHNNVA